MWSPPFKRSVRAVLLGVVTACLSMMMGGVCGVAVRGLRVMGRPLVIAALVVLGRLTMMTSSMLVMLCRL